MSPHDVVVAAGAAADAVADTLARDTSTQICLAAVQVAVLLAAVFGVWLLVALVDSKGEELAIKARKLLRRVK